MCFTTHIKEVSEKADKLGTALSQIMPNVEVPNACKRRLICSAVESIKLYAAPVWHLALKRESYKQAMLRVHRKAAIRISSAYRTIFNSAVMVIAGTIPIDIKARERVVVFKKEVIKTDARTDSLEEWQSRRRIDNTGAWTRRLVPEWAWMLWGVPEAHRKTRQRKLLVLPRKGYTGTHAVHMPEMG
ncbi:uncharacterized protein LOC135136623 [Zophobas morio]|uniref:uncharacterized protein LOC135136623 n=1 Tax=Zophobas morio TaxID=2755281 RepID=UPI003083AF87